jgi:predicted outer membrane repeat protein
VGNATSTEGGVVLVYKASMNMTGCSFAACSSTVTGGGAISFTAEGDVSHILRVVSCGFLFCEHYTSGNDFGAGGCIRLFYGGAYCYNCSFLNCRSNQNGGAIAQIIQTNVVDSSAVLELEKCIFASNVAGFGGGAIDTKEVTLKCTNCSFLHNTAVVRGGAIASKVKSYFYSIRSVFVRNFVSSCTGSDSGGAISIIPESDTTQVNVTQSIFIGNYLAKDSCSSLLNFYIIIFLCFFFFFFFLLRKIK